MIPVSTEARQHYLSDHRDIGYSYFAVFRDLGVCKVNSDILSESLEVTESICSAGKFKVGLCEAATAGLTVNMPENTEGDEVTIFQAQGDFQPQIEADADKGLQFSGDGVTELYSGNIDPTAEVIIGTETAQFEAGKYYLVLMRLWYVGDEIYVYVKSDDDITRMVYYYLPKQQDLTHLKDYSAGTTYNKGAKVWYDSKVYKSLINGNTSTPAAGEQWEDITAYIQIALPMIGEDFESFHKALYSNHTGLNGYATFYEIAYPLMPLGLFTIASSKRHEDRQLRDIRGYDRMNTAKLGDDINLNTTAGDSVYVSDILDYAANGTQIIVGSNLAQNPVTVETEGQSSASVNVGRVYHSYRHEKEEGVKGTFVPQPVAREACYILYNSYWELHVNIDNEDTEFVLRLAHEIWDSWPLSMQEIIPFTNYYKQLARMDEEAFKAYHAKFEDLYTYRMYYHENYMHNADYIGLHSELLSTWPKSVRITKPDAAPRADEEICFEYIPTDPFYDVFDIAARIFSPDPYHKGWWDANNDWTITSMQTIEYDWGIENISPIPHVLIKARATIRQPHPSGTSDWSVAHFSWDTNLTQRKTINGLGVENLGRWQISSGAIFNDASEDWSNPESFNRRVNLTERVWFYGAFVYNEPKGNGWTVTAQAYNRQADYDAGKISFYELVKGGKTRTYERDVNIDWSETLVKTTANYWISNYVAREDMVYFVKLHSPETQGAYRTEDDVRELALAEGELTVDEQERARSVILANSTPSGGVVIDENGRFTVEYISQIQYSSYDGYDTKSSAIGFENPYYGVTYHSKDELFNDLQIIVGNEQIHTTRRAVIRAILELNGLFIHFDRYGVSSFMRFTEAYTDYSYTAEETPLINTQEQEIELVNHLISLRAVIDNTYTVNDLLLMTTSEEELTIDDPVYVVEADGHTYSFTETIKVRTDVYALPFYEAEHRYQYEIESDLPGVKDYENDIRDLAAAIGTLSVDKQADVLAAIDAFPETVHMADGEITVSYVSEIGYRETVDGEETATGEYVADSTLRTVYERYIGFVDFNPVYITENTTPDTVSDLLVELEKEGEITLENPIYEVVSGGQTYSWREKITTKTVIYELPYYNKDYGCVYGIVSDLPALKADEQAIKDMAAAVGTLTTDKQADVIALIDAFEEKVEITPEDNSRVRVTYISGISYVKSIDGVDTETNTYTVQAPLREITGETFINEKITVTTLKYQIPDYFDGNDYTPHLSNSKDGVIAAEDDVRDEALETGSLLRDLQAEALATIDRTAITEEITINEDGTFTVTYISKLTSTWRHSMTETTRTDYEAANPYTGYDARIYHGARLRSDECMSLYVNDRSNRAFDGIKILKSSEKTAEELGLYPFYWNNTAAEDVSADMPEIGKWEGNNYYVIEDNFFISNFIFTEEQLVTVCKKLYERIDNFRYFNLKAKFKALPYTEVGDAIIISTPQNRYNTALLRRTMSGDLSMVDTIETEFYDD